MERGNIGNKKTLKLSQLKKILLLIAIIGVIGILIYIKIKPDLQTFVQKEVIVTETIVNDGEKMIEIQESENIDVVETFPATMTDSEIQNAIHQMSHQKVQAEEKWGMIPLTNERVLRLIDVVKDNKNNFKHANVYSNILNRWVKDDFSKVDSDHNTIWT